MRRSKLLQRILLAGCLLPTAFCVLALAQGGTGKLPPIRKLPPPIRRPTPRPPVNRDGGTGSTTVSMVVGSGEVRPVRFVRLTSEVAGRILKIYVTPGDEISKSQALVTIESQSPTGRREVTQYSPINGVAADISTRVGEVVSTSMSASPLMTLADMSKVFVEIAVEEDDFSKVANGQAATIIVDAFSNDLIRGVVTAKSPLSIDPSDPLASATTKEFKVRIELSKIPVQIRNRLRPGMSATATITVLTRK